MHNRHNCTASDIILYLGISSNIIQHHCALRLIVGGQLEFLSWQKAGKCWKNVSHKFLRLWFPDSTITFVKGWHYKNWIPLWPSEWIIKMAIPSWPSEWSVKIALPLWPSEWSENKAIPFLPSAEWRVKKIIPFWSFHTWTSIEKSLKILVSGQNFLDLSHPIGKRALPTKTLVFRT